MKLYLGCGPTPFHEQHLDVMGNFDEWVWVDKYVNHPKILNWDASDLLVKDGTIEQIYNSHLLEHISHVDVPRTLSHWYDKLKEGGILTINVPDMEWVAQLIRKYCAGTPLEGYYTQWEGEHGIQSIIYGSHYHEGEYHKSGYTEDSITALLTKAKFKDIVVKKMIDAHSFGILLVTCKK